MPQSKHIVRTPTLPPSVLVADSSDEIRAVLQAVLAHKGFEVLLASNGAAATDRLERDAIALVVLNIEMHDIAGVALFTRVRSVTDAPVILIGDGRDDTQLLQGLELGADDYFAKPFNPDLLAARAHALLRRTGAISPTEVSAGDTTLDYVELTLTVAGTTFRVSRLQAAVLGTLIAHADHYVSARKIMKHLWGTCGPAERKAIKATVYRFRRALPRDSSAFAALASKRPFGYCWRVSDRGRTGR